ncbi:MAG: UDP-N-acetylmuramoyl-tripeptide--D-alanyl-D-alanine ligase [Bacilli bacterium]|nr:UDP-N-acetylmuramoyl-tripeptide--D-alanyl-D-alanine ligase [Bacilli bacterium]
MTIILVLLLITFFYAIYHKSHRSLHMLQQNLYNENNRYLKWVLKNGKDFLCMDIIVIVISTIGLFVVFDVSLISNLCMILVILFLMLIGYTTHKNNLNDQNKKKLVITARIKRLIFTMTLLHVIPLFLCNCSINNPNTIWMLILIEGILLYLNRLVVFLAMIINIPVERLVYLHFKLKAQKKIKSMPNLKIIGITGSYGKTSSKRILSEILNVKYNALPTPKNLNTFNGLIMTINNHMDKFTDIFIAEMGAYVKGEIARLCKLVKPKYGIITRIGTAHLESFGSQENIQKGKFELIESLPSDGFGVLNADDPLQTSYHIKNNVRIIWVGIDNEEVDVRAKNIKCSGKGTTFDVVFKDDPKEYKIETHLLGRHNVYNILAAIACGKEFGIEMEDLQRAISNVRAVEHRLEIKKLGNFYQIDDAYNSNPIGAQNACEILKMMPGMKIVVTPGMIELGAKEDEYNEAFGEQIAQAADLVILIGEKKTKPIKEGLLKKGFEEEKIIVFNDVRDAFPVIMKEAQDKEVYALFENDLPDTFNEK